MSFRLTNTQRTALRLIAGVGRTGRKGIKAQRAFDLFPRTTIQALFRRKLVKTERARYGRGVSVIISATEAGKAQAAK